jgi:N,N'-diacetyllegionaminate synthase
MRIAGFDTDERVLVVAEIGNNHEGDAGVARELVAAAAEAGADAVKFQTFRVDGFVSPSDAERYERMSRFELPADAFAELAELAHAHSLVFLSTALDLESVDALAPVVDAYKIASGDIDFFPLLEAVAAAGKPVVLSTGQSEPAEIERAVGVLGGSVGVLHCVSSYPAPEAELNLRAIGVLAGLLPGCTIGFSDHTVGLDAAPLAVACGARIVEKHFTLDRGYSDFRDHALSVDPDGLRELVARIRSAEELLGAAEKAVQPSEREARVAVRRSVAAARALPAGHRLTMADLVWTRPADGLRPGQEDDVLGRTLRRHVAQGEHLRPDDVGN